MKRSVKGPLQAIDDVRIPTFRPGDMVIMQPGASLTPRPGLSSVDNPGYCVCYDEATFALVVSTTSVRSVFYDPPEFHTEVCVLVKGTRLGWALAADVFTLDELS